MRLLWLFLCLFCLCTCQLSQIQETVKPLPLNQDSEKIAIASGATHHYEIYLETGQLLDLRVDQLGADVVVRLDDLLLDGFTHTDGPEHLLFLAPQSQSYLLRILGPTYHHGHYRITATRGQPNPQQQGEADAHRLLMHALQEPEEERLPQLHRALSLAQDPVLRARIRARIAWAHERCGQLSEATQTLSEVASQCHSLDLSYLATETYRGLGNLLAEGQPQLALSQYQQALVAAQASQSNYLQARVMLDLGRLYYQQGSFQDAIATHALAIQLIGTQYPDLRARLQRDQALCYVTCGRVMLARDLLLESRQWWEQTDQALQIAKTTIDIGWTWYVQNNQERALNSYHALLPEVGRLPSNIQAGLHDRTGSAYRQLNRFSRARHHYNKALNLAGGVNQAHVHANLADMYLRQGNPRKAHTHAEQAATTFRTHHSPLFLANALFLQSKAQRLLNLPTQNLLRQVGELIQKIRAETTSTSQSMSFGTHYYDMLLELVTTLLEEGSGNKQQVLEAFEFMESVRGLSAWNQLQDALLPDRPATRQLKAITHQIDALQYRQIADPLTAPRLRYLLEQSQLLLAHIRKEQRRARAQMPAINLVHIRQSLLTQDSMLLSYCFGESRSYLWAITTTEIEVFSLPPAKQLRFQVENYYNRLVQPGWGIEQTWRVARALSQTLLQPVAHLLPQKNLIIVKDDLLHQIPFAPLPNPNQPDQPLIAQHQVAVLPSATHGVLARYIARNRPIAPKPVLVLADSVYRSDDPRLPQPKAPDHYQPPRLPYTAREAETIAALQPQANVRLGFQATRDFLLGHDLSQYQVVHFGIHGQLHPEHALLSSLLFSQFYLDGSPRDGALRAHQLANLHLPVELATLSGCKTALGKAYGEGLWSLGRDFRSAGALRVLVSLWDVEDRATATLMKAFYTALWDQGQAPAAALQTAQNQLLQSTYANPYYWAGFELQGDLFPFSSEKAK